MYLSSGPQLTDQINFNFGAVGAVPLHWNFLVHPGTSQDDAAFRASADNNITVAVCHPTLFGNITLNPVLLFVSFYCLLGFEHIFFWYKEESLAWSPKNSLLGNLSHVMLTPNS
jgi:hypothetical protein